MADADIITLDDFTGPTTDEGGGQYEQYVSADAPDHNPFADYPEQVTAGSVPALIDVPMSVTYTLAHNLAVRRSKVWACWGNGVVVGWIGDAAHQAECSDHDPDSVGVVHAIDPMVTGTRAQTIVNQCLAHTSDLQYVIHNRVIWESKTGWKARKYTGSNPHTDHVHISGKHGGSHEGGHTCTGYDLTAQAANPTFDICPAPKPPTPKPPVKPSAHAPGTRTLKAANPDLSGDDVEFVQRFIGSKHCGAPDRNYGPKTVAGVKWYQGMRVIHVDGEVGKQTFGQMGVRWTA